MKIRLRSLLPIVILLTCSISIRVLFAPIAPNMYIGGDSVGYYNLGKKMIMAPSLSTIVTPYRVPLYPFLVASFVPGPDEFPDGYLAPEIVLGVHHLMVFQSVLGVISVIFVYLLFISCNTGVVLAFFGALFFALNPQIFLWERTMLSEGVVISFFVIFLYACVCVLRKTTWYSLLFFSIFGTICFLTRPANLLIPLTVFPFIIWNNKKRKSTLIAICLCILLYLSVPLGYRGINKIVHGFNGIQQGGSISILGCILENDIPIQAGRSAPFFYQIITALPQIKDPFRLIDYVDFSIYQDRQKIEELNTFNRLVIFDQPIRYTLGALQKIPNYISDYTFLDDYLSVIYSNPRYMMFSYLNAMYGYIKLSTWITYLLIPIAFIYWLRKKSFQHEVLVIFPLIFFIQSLITAFLVYHTEYGRLSGSIIPVIYISVILWLRFFMTQGFVRTKSVKNV